MEQITLTREDFRRKAISAFTSPDGIVEKLGNEAGGGFRLDGCVDGNEHPA